MIAGAAALAAAAGIGLYPAVSAGRVPWLPPAVAAVPLSGGVLLTVAGVVATLLVLGLIAKLAAQRG